MDSGIPSINDFGRKIQEEKNLSFYIKLSILCNLGYMQM